ERRGFELQSGDDRGDRDAELRVARDETRETLVDFRLYAAPAQQIEQQFSSSRRFGREQHACRARLEMCDERCGRLIGAGIDAHRGGRQTWEVLYGALRFRRPLELMQLNPAPSGERVVEFGGRQIQFGRLEDRAVAIVTQLLVAQHDSLPKTLARSACVVDV